MECNPAPRDTPPLIIKAGEGKGCLKVGGGSAIKGGINNVQICYLSVSAI